MVAELFVSLPDIPTVRRMSHSIQAAFPLLKTSALHRPLAEVRLLADKTTDGTDSCPFLHVQSLCSSFIDIVISYLIL